MTDDFKKYPSLIHVDHEKDIAWWLENYPDLNTCKYLVREKFDGANLQILFLPDGTYKVGKRTAWIEPDEKFYDVYGAIERAPNMMQCFKELAWEEHPVRVFFELHGPSINKRVYYGDKLQLTILDIVDGDRWYTPWDLSTFLESELPEHHKIYMRTLLSIHDNFAQAIKASCDFNSFFSDKVDNPAEGIVIRPMHHNVYNGRGEMFILKHKSADFDESKAKLKEYHAKVLTDLQKAFMGYINENRILSVFTKHGQITSQKQIGDYIKLVMNDAKEDFFKDHPDIDMNDRDTFSMGGNLIVPLLRKHIMSN